MKILVLGCKGQLGKCLNDQLTKTDYEIVYTSRNELDITDFALTQNKIKQISPDCIINATAYTAVDEAENNIEIADLVNHLAVANIAKISKKLDCFLIHISTDYVFDGNSKISYKEDDKTNPKGVYGKTKLRGERAVQISGCRFVIIRTGWVFSEYGDNFLKTMLRLRKEHELNIVSDQVGCPTYAQDIAIAIINIISHLKYDKDITGLYHFSGDSKCSWFEFANEIYKRLSNYYGTAVPALEAIPSKDYPTAAKRPKFSVLDNAKIYKEFNISSSNWKEGIENSLKNLLTE